MKKEIELQIERDKELRKIQGSIDEAEGLKGAVMDEIQRLEKAIPAICAEGFMADDGRHVDDMANMGALKSEKEYLDFTIRGLREMTVPDEARENQLLILEDMRGRFDELKTCIKEGAEVLPILENEIRNAGGDHKKAERVLQTLGWGKIANAKMLNRHVSEAAGIAKELDESGGFEVFVMETTGKTVAEWR